MAGNAAFSRDLLTLLGGTALAQAIPLMAAPFLARLYTPEQFGALALLLAIANPISLVVCGRYELAVTIPREDERAGVLVRLGSLVAIASTVVLGGLIVLFRIPLSGLLGGSGAMMSLVLAPVLFGMMGAFQPLNNWLIRRQAFRAMGMNKMVQTSVITMVSMGLGWGSVHHGLCMAYIAGWAAYLGVGLLQARQHGFRFGPLDPAALLQAGRDHLDFPLYNALPALLHTATLSIPVLFMVRTFGEEATGQLNLCRQTVFLPVTFFATTWMQVYMQRASRSIIERHAVLPGLRKGLLVLASAALVIAAVLLLAGPVLFGWVFGPAWTEAGVYARWMAVSIAMQFIVTPLSVLLPPLGRIRQFSTWQMAYFVLVLGYSLLPFESPVAYLGGLAWLESIILFGLLLFILRSARRHDRDLRPDDAAPAA